MARLRSTKRRNSKQAGFTLIEVLIALAIFSLAMTVLIPVYSNSLRIANVTNHQTLARLRLETLLSEMGVVRPLQIGEEAGDYGDGFTWLLIVEPHKTTAQVQSRPTEAYRVTATVSWRDHNQERSLSLSTLQIGAGEGG